MSCILSKWTFFRRLVFDRPPGQQVHCIPTDYREGWLYFGRPCAKEYEGGPSIRSVRLHMRDKSEGKFANMLYLVVACLLSVTASGLPTP